MTLSENVEPSKQKKTVFQKYSIRLLRESSSRYNVASKKADTPEKCVAILREVFDTSNLPMEQFWVLALDRKNEVISCHIITTGTASASLVHPREVFQPVLLANACAFVCAHNHPSGDPAPSTADLQVTRQLKDAAKVMGIDFHDHVIVGMSESDPRGQGYFSFRESGLI